MSLDDDMPARHAEILEREHYERPASNRHILPESRAADQIVDQLVPWLSPNWLSRQCLHDIAMKLVARRAAIRLIFDGVDADPSKLDAHRNLRQQQAQSYEDRESIEECLKSAQDDVAHFTALLASMPHVPEYDPDARGEREDDDRLRDARHDERGAAEAVRP